jgi:hypothetical protein
VFGQIRVEDHRRRIAALVVFFLATAVQSSVSAVERCWSMMKSALEQIMPSQEQLFEELVYSTIPATLVAYAQREAGSRGSRAAMAIASRITSMVGGRERTEWEAFCFRALGAARPRSAR